MNTKRLLLRQRGFEPKLEDSEVITMEIVGEYCGINKDTHYKVLSTHNPKVDERISLWDICSNLKGLLLGDEGFFRFEVFIRYFKYKFNKR